jgi:tetraacyldisaccharide 4'-kinase
MRLPWQIDLQPPGFWQRPPGLATALLGPIARRYGDHVIARMGHSGVRAGVPVLCIGNFTLGGAGKTPLALLIAGFLRETGEKPAFLTRGYGGNEHGPRLVLEGDSAARVGDESLLLARVAPTIVAADRAAGAALAIQGGATIIVMDDGFQNPTLNKDCSIVVVDGETGIGNGLSFPAGPLRAPLHAQMPFASAVLAIGPGDAGTRVLDFARGSGCEVFRARLAVEGQAPALRGKRVLAFAGIGRPQKFFKTLADLGAVIAASEVFADHHPFSERDAARIATRAQTEKLVPVTTTKDMTRLAGGPARDGLASMTMSVPVRLILDDEAALRRFLERMFKLRSSDEA